MVAMSDAEEFLSPIALMLTASCLSLCRSQASFRGCRRGGVFSDDLGCVECFRDDNGRRELFAPLFSSAV